MSLSHQFTWSRFARSLTLPALTIALTATAGCRGDGSTKPSLSAMSPMRWFARGETSIEADDNGDLKQIPGDFSTPPVPPSSRVGRAVVPAPPPEPDAFYGVRPTSQESHESEPRPWSQTLRGMFEPEPKLKPIPSDVEPISHAEGGISAYQRTSGALNEPPVPPPLLVPPAEPDPSAPANIATHIEPVSTPRPPGRLPIIAARRFPMLPSVEPSPWPHRSIAQDRRVTDPHRIAATRPAVSRATFLPLPGGDSTEGPALLP
jgi:hypothetical protein